MPLVNNIQDVNPNQSFGDRAADFWLGTKRQIATAPMISEDLANINRYGFYGDLAGAQARNVGIAGQQQALADALAARARGEGGPSLAEMQLQQTLEQQQKGAAGALAGIRGMNPAAAQRLLLSQKAQLGQQAAGQGAMLRAQEQLAAQQALGQQLAGMRGAETAQYGQAGQLGLGQEKYATEAGLAVAKANQEAEQERQRLQNAADAAYNKQSMETKKAVGEAAVEVGKAFLAHGGEVKGYADGDFISSLAYGSGRGGTPIQMPAEGGGGDSWGKAMHELGQAIKKHREKKAAGAKAGGKPINPEQKPEQKPEEKPAEIVEEPTAAPSEIEAAADTASETPEPQAESAAPMEEAPEEAPEEEEGGGDEGGGDEGGDEGEGEAHGGVIKPAKKIAIKAAQGRLEKLDNKKNDVVPAMLSEGEAVIPRSVMKSPNPPLAAAKFVEALLAKKTPKAAKREALKLALSSR